MENLFRKQSMDNLASPDGLNSYIKTTSLSVWVLLGAVIAFAVGLIVWGIFGSVATSVDTSAYVKNNEAVCFFENTDGLSEGMTVTGESFKGKIVTVGDTPVSKADVSELIGDEYAMYILYRNAELQCNSDRGRIGCNCGECSHGKGYLRKAKKRHAG